jgi:crossover junction endodeoxyribonuclease RuvC
VVRVLGIDPGSRLTGWGIVEHQASAVRHVDNGALVLDAKAPLTERLIAIHEGVSAIIERYAPYVMAVEGVFAARNVASALKLGHARGAALVAAGRLGLAIYEYAPAEVKQAVVGHGRAEKQQVQAMVRVILGLPEVAQADASDALAVAICHCQRGSAFGGALLGLTARRLGRGTP